MIAPFIGVIILAGLIVELITHHVFKIESEFIREEIAYGRKAV